MQTWIDWMAARGGAVGAIIAGVVVVLLAIGFAFAAHRILVAVLRRATSRTPNNSDDIILAHGSPPVKWIMVLVAVTVALRMAPLGDWAANVLRQISGFALPALFGWLAIALVRAMKEILDLRTDISVEDNLQARRKRTRVSILMRIVTVLIIFLSVCMMLLSIPGVRNVGMTLIASAGLVGLAVGAAAQPALKNLIAGVQMAFTEPIRIDDVVIIAGEWGRIEDIRLTFVVVKIWDERRLVVPVSKFLEEPFQNWTRESSNLLGSAFLYVDPTTDVARLRAKLAEVVKASALWDGRFFNLQVTDIKDDVMEVRALMTAADASKTFDLRCEVREKLMAYIANEMPGALARHRLDALTTENDTPTRRAA